VRLSFAMTKAKRTGYFGEGKRCSSFGERDCQFITGQSSMTMTSRVSTNFTFFSKLCHLDTLRGVKSFCEGYTFIPK